LLHVAGNDHLYLAFDICSAPPRELNRRMLRMAITADFVYFDVPAAISAALGARAQHRSATAATDTVT
jgi:hypothetical protein